MKFYKKEYQKALRTQLEYPCIVLTTDTWNDWAIAQTLFHVTYYENEYNPIHFGDIKIMTTESHITRSVLPETFDELDDSYCSLGQNLEFYKKVSELSPVLYLKLLNGLRDCAYDEKIAAEFETNNVFVNSLLRFSEAEKAFKEARKYFGEVATKILEFSFEYQIEEANSPHIVSLNFEEDNLPFRINAFVGKNATGKTKILTELASHISGVRRNRGNFSPRRPSFSKVIAISYGAFDELYKPFDVTEKDELQDMTEDNELFSYKYCGLRNKEGVLSLTELEKHFFQSYSDIEERGRIEDWKKIMRNVFEEEHLELIDSISKSEVKSGLSNLLSSGQNILLSTITDVIAYIEEDSLLLFDEPEIHLHPNAIANFMRMFYEILEDFNSFAIISTHSPIIIQEIPSKYVRVFSRIDRTPIIENPSIECFGENISSITNEIFEVRENESNYKTIFKKLASNFDQEQLIELFEDDLSFNALTYLNNVYKGKKVK